MARAGKPLDPWQVDGIDLMCSVRPDHQWACFEYAEIVARQNGKGGLLEARALAGLLLYGEETIMWSAHQYKTSMEAFRRVRTLLRRLGQPINDVLVEVDGILIKILNTNGEESFERLDTEQRIMFIARSKASGRGFSGDVNIIDETFAYTEDQHSALMPTMSAMPNPQIIYTSTPPLDGKTGEVLFDLRKRALEGGDDGLGFRDWGLGISLDDIEKVDVDDPENLAATNPALGIRITEEFIRRERRSMSKVGYGREVLCMWPKRIQGGGAIDLVAWAKLADPDSRRAGEVALGVDIAPNRDYAAISMYGIRDDLFGHLHLIKYLPGTHWIVDALVELRDVLDPLAIGMGRSTAASLETDLKEVGIIRPADPEKPERGNLAVTTSTDMAAACGQILDAIRQGTDRHKPEQALDASVAGAKTRMVGDAIAWATKTADADTSPLVSVTLARWAYRYRLEAVTKPKETAAPWVYRG